MADPLYRDPYAESDRPQPGTGGAQGAAGTGIANISEADLQKLIQMLQQMGPQRMPLPSAEGLQRMPLPQPQMQRMPLANPTEQERRMMEQQMMANPTEQERQRLLRGY